MMIRVSRFEAVFTARAPLREQTILVVIQALEAVFTAVIGSRPDEEAARSTHSSLHCGVNN